MSAGPMTSADAAKALMRADMATGGATKRSLGVMYAMIMAGAGTDNFTMWRSINEPIIAYRGITFLDGVKKAAWSIYEEAARNTQVLP